MIFGVTLALWLRRGKVWAARFLLTITTSVVAILLVCLLSGYARAFALNIAFVVVLLLTAAGMVFVCLPAAPADRLNTRRLDASDAIDVPTERIDETK